VSNALHYDSLLLRALASELDARLRGMPVARAEFERATRTLVLATGTTRQPLTLRWQLHPSAAGVTLTGDTRPSRGRRLSLPPDAAIARVSAPPDERLVRMELTAARPGPGEVRGILLELIGSRWNAYGLEADDVIVAALVARPNDPRGLRPGVPYRRPAAPPRQGLEEAPHLVQWLAILSPIPPVRRRAALLATFAFTSVLNADWILGGAAVADEERLLEEAYRRYRWLTDATPEPCLLDGRQPYLRPLSGSEPRTATLLEAFALAAAGFESKVATGDRELHEQVLARVADREERLRARLERLAREAEGASVEAAELRARADLLLAHLHEIPRGTGQIVLTDFDDRERRLSLDPARSPRQNAQDWYRQAGRRVRAARRVPGLRQRTERELSRLASFRERLSAGQATEAELAPWLRQPESAAARVALPYRRYRTSGGLEVRVGRNARANDALTRDHASAEDIWLHARDAGGAHVVLRWGRRGDNPARGDLIEAAVLAALHSRARTAAVVPVDWTRRKYVRKPRKAAPGQVLLERSRTIFVAPDRAVEQRLRLDESD